jgi:signal transduction histidine kinase
MAEPGQANATVRAARNFASESIAQFGELPQELSAVRDDGQPTVYDTNATAQMPAPLRDLLEREGIKASMGTPIRSAQGTVIGGYGVAYTTPHDFSEDEKRLLLALAERAAVAIQNADLYAKAQHAASLEERQRLARELHDSVSQALYGIALGTRTARMRLGDDPQNAAEPIDYVATLAQAGLAEMRALIFELRPESLEQEGVVAAIEKQAASIAARYKLDVKTELGDEPDAQIEVKEAAYRIAQEALHNIVKHAQAQHVSVTLRRDDGQLLLEVRDDGRGFDASAVYPGHVGLQSMSERALKIGGRLTIESTPGKGSKVSARLPAQAL